MRSVRPQWMICSILFIQKKRCVTRIRSVILIEPYPEKLVVNAVNALLVRNEILFEQSFERRLHRTRRRQAVFLDELPGGNGTGSAFLADGDEAVN